MRQTTYVTLYSHADAPVVLSVLFEDQSTFAAAATLCQTHQHIHRHTGRLRRGRMMDMFERMFYKSRCRTIDRNTAGI